MLHKTVRLRADDVQLGMTQNEHSISIDLSALEE